MNTVIFESGLIKTLTAIGLDTDFGNIGKILFTSGASGNVACVFEDDTVLIMPVEVIQDGHPRIKQINTTGTTVTTSDIYIGFQ